MACQSAPNIDMGIQRGARESMHNIFRLRDHSEGGMIRLETLIELKFIIRAFELIQLLKLDKRSPAERFEATVSQSSVPCLPLFLYDMYMYMYMHMHMYMYMYICMYVYIYI